MKNLFKLILLCIFFNQTCAQPIFKGYKPLELSQGKRMVVSGAPLLMYDAADSKNSTFLFNLDASYNFWKFTPKKNVGGYADAFINTSSVRINDSSISSSAFGTTVYGGMNYYLKPNKFYGTAAIGANISKLKIADSSYDATTPVYLWAGVGYGRIFNEQRVVIALDFLSTLNELGIAKGKLTTEGLIKLAHLLDRRTNGEFNALYKDNDADIEFFAELESLLLGEGLITTPLNARSALKLYQMLTNPSYVYYPRYKGWQVQSELQLQLVTAVSGETAHDHYLSFTGVYGKPLGFKTQVVGSAFASFALDKLASGMPPPFFSFLAFIPDRTTLDFYTGNYGTGIYGGHYTPLKTIFLGIRGDVFHNFSNVAGVRGYLELMRGYPSLGEKTEKVEVGGRFDFNILDRLAVYTQARITKIGNVDASYNFQAGFVFFVF